jgi:hypothetical protein
VALRSTYTSVTLELFFTGLEIGITTFNKKNHKLLSVLEISVIFS